MMLKKALKSLLKLNKTVVILFFVALLFRLYQLDKFPIGITHDELNYVFAAKSLWHVKTYSPGTAPTLLPTSMQYFTVVIAEIPALILALFQGVVSLNLFNSRLLGAVLSSANVVLIYFLTKHFTENNKTSLVTSMIAIVNPWSFLMGRTIFEVNFFVFFFLLGLLVLLKNKGKKIFYSLPLFVLGFLSYTGGQVVFLLFVIASLIYRYYVGKNNDIRPYLLYFGVIVVVFVAYVFVVLNNQSFSSRGGELYLPTHPSIADQVNKERLLSIPSSFDAIFTNKLTLYSKNFLDKYLDAFSTDKLFLNGEFRAAFSYQKHGTFYPVDFVFLIVGLAVLFSINKNGWFFVLVTILISPITSGLSGIEHSYSQRSGLMYPFMIILVGIGFGWIIGKLQKINFGRIFVVGLFLVYLLFVLNLMHIYFYRFPVYASEGWFYQDRVMSRYIELAKTNTPDREIVVSTFEPKIVFEEYLFYSGNYNTEEQVRMINKQLAEENYSIGKVRFISNCLDDVEEVGNTVWIYDAQIKCKGEAYQLRITRLLDTNTNYFVENDELCKNYELGRYISPTVYDNFSVEGQSDREFCLSWITQIK